MHSPLRHRARLSPLQPETEWALEGDELTERRGGHLRRFQLSGLSRMDILTRPRRAVRLVFGWISTVIIPADSFAGPGRYEPRLASFEPLLDAIAVQAAHAAPRARIATATSDLGAVLLTVSVLLGAMAVAFALFSLPLGAAAIGLSLGARMLFAAILLLAVRPWVGRRPGG